MGLTSSTVDVGATSPRVGRLRGPRPVRRLASRHPLAAYILRRTAIGLIIALLVSVLVFAGTQVLPGDVANAILGRNATPASLHQLRVQLGLNQPITAQYFSWLGHLLSGNLGTSLAAQVPVGQLISAKIVNSLVLAGVTIVLLIPLSLGLGILAGTRRGRLLDKIISNLTLGAIALPEFVTGTILVVVFAVNLKLLPAVSLVPSGTDPLTQPSLLVLPVTTLLIVSLAYTIRMVRAGVADVMSSEYVQSARLNGIPERRVIRRHVLRNALAPSVQTFALTIQFLIGGVIVVETVFQYPGLGLQLAQSVEARDIPVVQTVALLLAIVYIAINIAADVVVVLLIPKLRTAQ
jgi:peptide/nickel transport system permease protein